MDKLNQHNEKPFVIPVDVLTKSQVDFYDKNGYLVVENVFSNELCDQSLATFEKHAEADFSSIMNLDRTENEIRNLLKTIDQEISRSMAMDADCNWVWAVGLLLAVLVSLWGFNHRDRRK